MSNKKPVIGITMGDFNGVGPEIIIKSLIHNDILNLCTPVIYGSVGIINQYCKLLKIENFNFSKISSIDEVKHGKISVLNCWPDDYQINPGNPTSESGTSAFESLKKACLDIKEGHLDIIVTAPIDKKNIQSEEFKFPGHTEYLIKEFNAPEGLMILKGELLTVATISSHISIKEVPEKVKKERIIKSVKALAKSLKTDFGIEKPKIGILGLNPHAGDQGLFGNEESKEIQPAIVALKEMNILAFGPYGPDGLFGSGEFEKFDAILGMYHDQVLIPFKLLEFETGVNFTSGLSIIRTSPDHGTAFDIAGKNKANPRSMKHAIFTALDIFQHRNNNK